VLIKLDVGLGLGEEIPVRNRTEIIVPTGWSAGTGSYVSLSFEEHLRAPVIHV